MLLSNYMFKKVIKVLTNIEAFSFLVSLSKFYDSFDSEILEPDLAIAGRA